MAGYMSHTVYMAVKNTDLKATLKIISGQCLELTAGSCPGPLGGVFSQLRNIVHVFFF